MYASTITCDETDQAYLWATCKGVSLLSRGFFAMVGIILLLAVVFWYNSEPKIFDTSLDEGALVTDVFTPVVFEFDRMVAVDTLEQRIMITPTTPLTLHWQNDQVLKIMPQDGWQRGCDYQLEILPGVSSRWGNSLTWGKTSSSHYMWYFTVEWPQLIDYRPQEEISEPNAHLTLVFDVPMDLQSVQDDFIIEPSVPLQWEQKEAHIIIANPIIPWKQGQTYTVTLGGDIEARGFSTTWQFTFPKPQTITLTLLGDTLLTQLPKGIIDYENPSKPYSKLHANLLQPKDLIFANLENPISSRGTEQTAKSYRFRSEPETVAILQAGHIKVVSVSNNHSLDFGPQALADTVKYCNQVGIATVGYGPQGADSVEATIIEHQGHKVGFLAYTDPNIVPAHYHRLWEGHGGQPGVKFIGEGLEDKVAALKEQVDIVAVSLHWGIENLHQVTREQRAVAHTLINAGADLIIGHHPHVPQAIEQYQGGLIFYSLGNFVFPPSTRDHRRDSFAAKVEIGTKGIERVALYPHRPGGGQPTAMDTEEATMFIRQLDQWSRQYGTVVRVDGDLGQVQLK